MGDWIDRFGYPSGPNPPPGTLAPLAFSQEDMWFQAVLDLGDPSYNEYDAILIRGPLRRDALEAAMRRVAERQDVFRIRFREVDGEPRMEYLAEASFPLTFVDASAEPGANSPDNAHAWVRRIVREPFDLRAAPAARATLVRLEPDLHVYTIVMHHIVKDGTTESVMMRDLSRFYESELTGEEPELPELTASLAAYAQWQSGLLEAGGYDRQIAYWTEALRGIEAVDAAGDRPRPAERSTAGAKSYSTIEPGVVAALRALAGEEQASLYTVLIAAFALLLHRYTGKGEVPIAFPVGNRNRAIAENVGCFMNSLVLRAPFREEQTFRAWFREIRALLIEAYRNQDVPMARVVAHVELARRSDQNSAAAAAFMMRDPTWHRLSLSDCETERFDVDVGIAKQDLVLELEELSHGLFCKLEYRTSLYDPATAEAFLANYERLLRSIAANPETSFRRLDVIAPEERRVIEVLSRGPEVEVPASVLEMFAARVAENPEAIAVVGEGESATYRELDEAADRVACAIQPLLGSERIVALGVERSIAMVAGTLGIMKAGAAYLPLEMRNPPARLRAILDDARASPALVDAAAARALPAGIDVVRIDELLKAQSREKPSTATALDAYVMYTSGSTGLPKGVVIAHASLANEIDAFRRATGLGPGDRVLQFSSPSFDISVEEIFGALCAGASLALRPLGIEYHPRGFLETCGRLRATVLDLPTAYFHEVVAALDTASEEALWPSSLRLVVVGGEALRADLARRFLLQTGGRIRLLNTYGPTEATIVATMGDVTDAATTAIVPIGRPIQNVRLAILDPAGELVPRGAIGRLIIGGVAPARGYLRDDALTARRFVDDARIGRAFATDDLVRLTRDGAFEFHGRDDEQVKVRGYRVELGEIEAALAREASVRDAAVVRDDDGELLACVVPSGPTTRADDLRIALASWLPTYAVPRRIVLVEALPLNINGKRDREALLALADAFADVEKTTRAAATSAVTPSTTERRLVKIWEELLGRSPVGIDEDFFELGGHSLLAARMFARIEGEFGVRLPLQALFTRPTIARLAEAVLDERLHRWSLMSAHEVERPGLPIFFFHGDLTGGALYTRKFAQLLTPDRPFFAFAPHGSTGEPIPPSIEAMAEDYLTMVRRVQRHGPYTLGGHCVGGLIALEVARRLRERGEAVDYVFAVHPLSAHFVVRDVALWFDRARRAVGAPPWATERFARAAKVGWRFLERMLDPRRRGASLAQLARHLHLMPAAPEPVDTGGWGPDWRSTVGGRLLTLSDYFVPLPFDGRATIVRGSESPRELGSVWGWRRAARQTRIATVPGDYNTVFTDHVAELTAVIAEDLGVAPSSKAA